jgi:hypothetical protein
VSPDPSPNLRPPRRIKSRRASCCCTRTRHRQPVSSVAKNTKAEIAGFESWNQALKKTGLAPRAAELSLQDRASVRVLAGEIRRQENREAVAIEAIAEFKQSGNESNGVSETISPPIDIEWIDRFWRLAQDVSDADMQAVWGKILARKTTGQGTYSARCLETVSLLSHEEITHLERLATLLCSTSVLGAKTCYIVYNVHWLQTGHLPQDLQSRLRSSVGELHREIFGPAGIALDSGSGWAQDAFIEIKQSTANFSIANSKYALTFQNIPDGPKTIGASLGISPLGAEIFSLIKVAPNPAYIAALTDAFKFYNIEMRAT